MDGSAGPPRAPFVQPSFYLSDRSTDEALIQLVQLLVAAGASVEGNALMINATDLDAVDDPTAEAPTRVHVSNVDELLRLTREPGVALISVPLMGALPYCKSRTAQVRALPIPPGCIGRARHPVAIWLDGGPFAADASAPMRQRACEETNALFLLACERLRPAYGAVLFSWPLPSPCEFSSSHDLLLASIYYVARKLLSPEQEEELAVLLPATAYTAVDDGIVVFNGHDQDKRVENAAAELVARVISQGLCGDHLDA